MKPRRRRIDVPTLMLACALLAGCSASHLAPLNPSDYPNPPQAQRYEALPVYIAWNGLGGESWTYAFSAEDIVKEGSRPRQPQEENVITEDDPPGGRSVWFQGVSPGDTVITFTIRNARGQVKDILQYAIRVYEDLKLALLHAESKHFRD